MSATTRPASAESSVAAPVPPVVKRVEKVVTLHGEARSDPYFWLRDKPNPDVAAYLEAENAYTAAVMKPMEPLQDALYTEMLSHIKETDLSVPYREGEWLYYFRTEKGKQYRIYCRKRSPDGPEQVTLDLNELAKGQKFMALGRYAVSDDGNLLAYSTDSTGFRQYTLFIKDLRANSLWPERIEKTTGAVWAADNRTLFYGVEDAAKRPYRIYRHRLLEPQS
ncbi:MAG: oligopeptidase B, partial [Thermoanaerobaculia bacterium]